MKLLSLLLAACWFPSQIFAGTLVLIVDYSSSISGNDRALMRSAYEKSLLEIPSLRNMDIEVIFFAGEARLASSGTVDEAVLVFNETYDPVVSGPTCLEEALSIVINMYDDLEEPVIIDISGDGDANCDGKNYIPTALDYLESVGATVNTIFVAGIETVDNNYQSYVRNGGFYMEAKNYDDFQTSLYEKLVMETSEAFLEKRKKM